MLDDLPPSAAAPDSSTQSVLEAFSETSERCMPTVFISHGAPTIALETGLTGAAWARLGHNICRHFGQPNAIVVMSPHWIAHTQSVLSASSAPILHDFNGFPAPLYALDYPSQGDPNLAKNIQSMLLLQGFGCQLESERGLDHGAWVPLRSMFPHADIPVLQVSMPYPDNPEHYVQLGNILKPLTRQGVLIMGSGSMTHNLSEFKGQPVNTPADPYVEAFSTWVAQHLFAQDLLALLDYRDLAPFASRAHPSDDHLMPLFFAVGAADTLATSLLHSDVNYGILSMDCYAFGSQSHLLLS